MVIKLLLVLSWWLITSGNAYSNELAQFYRDYLLQKKMIDQVKTFRNNDIERSLFKVIGNKSRPRKVKNRKILDVNLINGPVENIKARGTTITNQYDSFIVDASKRYGLSPALIKAVIHAESGFDEYAVSRKGAAGLMQLMPGTAKEIGVTRTSVFNPKANIMGGTKLLRQYINRFRSVKKALIAYNAGPACITGKKRIPQETRKYISNVIRYYHVYKEKYKGQTKSAS